MESFSAVQTSYAIYSGDDQRRYLTDQGPLQNDVMARGIEASAIRSIFTDATSEVYLRHLFGKSMRQIRMALEQDAAAGYAETSFAGMIGMGDHLDLGCPAEAQALLASLASYAEIDPALFYRMMVPGNHDGGQYMGSLWSSRNLFGLVNIGGDDYREDTCGQEKPLYVADRIAFYDEILRTGGSCQEPRYQEITTVLKKGNKRFLQLEQADEKLFFRDRDQLFERVWHSTPERQRWDAVIHYNGESGDKEKSDVNNWFHVQAFLQEEFEFGEGETVPVYQIGLDTQDFTEAPLWQASIKGHISAVQISLVENFIDRKLAENPNAKFKIAMHYPVDGLTAGSLQAIKRLLNRDEIILVTNGHTHLQSYDRDLRQLIDLPDRTTPLAHLSIPSTMDAPRACVLEQMVFSQGSREGAYTIKFNFDFVSVDETEILGDEDSYLSRKMTQFKQNLLDERCSYFEHEGWDVDQRRCADGEKMCEVYSNREQLFESVPVDLQFVAESRHSRLKQFMRIVRTLFDFGDQLMNRLIVHVTIPQMRADFESYLVFLRNLEQILVEESQVALAQKLQGMIDIMVATKNEWDDEYAQIDEVLLYRKRKAFNDLYTRARLNDTVRFISQELPKDSMACEFAMLVGMEASQEYDAFYNGAHMTFGVLGNPVKESFSYQWDYL